MKQIALAATLVTALLLHGCLGSSTPGPAEVKREDNQVFIVDETGKHWEVSHAEEVYGLKAEDFEFGLGPFAIQPILDPKFVSPGETGYPGSDEGFLVIGAEFHGDARAYSIPVLSSVEIVDEVFDSTYVAVAY